MASARTRGGTADASVWQRRRFLSGALRVAVTLVPIAVSVGVSLVLSRALPSTSATIASIGRVLLIAACSLVALAMTDAVARKFLPLAALLQLSLVFPDQTPSRFRTALKGGSGRRLAREVAQARREGLSDDPSRAAQQLLILATAIGDHDRRTRGHSERVRLYTDLIAAELHLSDDERWKLQWAALIHDIGKITVPPEILNKKGPPDDREWSILKRHPVAGAELAAPVEPWLGDAVHAVAGHHERWDGTGYPYGLSGEAIPRSAAIVAVADAFEVMTAVRSYKKALPLTAARAELTRCAGSHFSPDVVRALLNVSIGRLRSSMGLFAAIAHLPFLGHIAKAASYAPDTVSTAAAFTTTGATAGAGVLALSSSMAMATAAPPTVEIPQPKPMSVEVEVAAVPVDLARFAMVEETTSTSVTPEPEPVAAITPTTAPPVVVMPIEEAPQTPEPPPSIVIETAVVTPPPVEEVAPPAVAVPEPSNNHGDDDSKKSDDHGDDDSRKSSDRVFTEKDRSGNSGRSGKSGKSDSSGRSGNSGKSDKSGRDDKQD
jgi:hypothetical protein